MPYLITDDPRKIGAEVERASGAYFREVMIQTWKNLTAAASKGGTPRDTNFASASWILSIGVPSTAVGGSKEKIDWTPARVGVSDLRAYSIDQGAIFLVNNTEYIVRLNYGWSSQAEAGFVERALASEELRAEATRVDVGDIT